MKTVIYVHFLPRRHQLRGDYDMHAAEVLHKALFSVIARLDAHNVRNIPLAVETLLRVQHLTLMELARHFPALSMSPFP